MTAPNEHIEWFKRFAAAYLRWANFNFDRIASDAVNRDRSNGIREHDEVRR